MKILITLLTAALLCGCLAKHSRMLNEGEKTLVSADVRELVLAAEDGLLDIREHKNIRCERIRIVGTHLLTRLCFTKEESREMARKTQEEYWKAFGFTKCLSDNCRGN